MMERRYTPTYRKKIVIDTSLSIVNIVLLLILFFLATGRLMNAPNQGVDLSRTTDLDVENLPSPALVVGPGGKMELDGEPISATELAAALAGKFQLYVLIAGDAPAQDLLDVMARPELGGLDVRLVTIHDSSGAEGG